MQCVLPLQPVRGNISRIQAALSEFKSLAKSVVARQHMVRGCILEGLQEALAQFKRLSVNSKQVKIERYPLLEVDTLSSDSNVNNSTTYPVSGGRPLPTLPQVSGGNTEFPSQIEITLITAHPPSYLRNLVENVATHLDLVNLRKISALVVSNPDSVLVGAGSCVEEESESHVTLDDAHMTSSISDLGEFEC